MTQITLDAVSARKLEGVQESVQLCDPNGRVLGRFVPLIDLSKWEPITPEISDEELERRLNSNQKRYTTDEVIKHLESL
jgi:hypothetical protein